MKEFEGPPKPEGRGNRQKRSPIASVQYFREVRYRATIAGVVTSTLFNGVINVAKDEEARRLRKWGREPSGCADGVNTPTPSERVINAAKEEARQLKGGDKLIS
jgi:hypothetical protein